MPLRSLLARTVYVVAILLAGGLKTADTVENDVVRRSEQHTEEPHHAMFDFLARMGLTLWCGVLRNAPRDRTMHCPRLFWLSGSL